MLGHGRSETTAHDSAVSRQAERSTLSQMDLLGQPLSLNLSHRESYPMPLEHLRIMDAIETCRTAALRTRLAISRI